MKEASHQLNNNVNNAWITDEEVMDVINDLSHTFTKLYEYDKDENVN